MGLKPGDKNFTVYIKAAQVEKVNLSADEMRTLILEGPGLFAKLKQTAASERYLDAHPELKEVIDRW